MKTKEITLCGKKVILAYCYATEIAFHAMADMDITLFVAQVADAIKKGQMPDVKKSMFFVMSALQAWTESQQEHQPQLTDHELMFDCTPTELGTAIGHVIALRQEFYHVPADEPADKPADKSSDSKNG